MAPELQTLDVRIVAISKDTPEEAALHKERDSLQHITLLADPQLEVIRQYGVEHHKAFGFDTRNTLTLGGIPLGLVPSFKVMAIPTSLIVDETGEVRWIDQSEDYRLRSNNDRVLGAARDVF